MQQPPLMISRMQCCGWREIARLSQYKGDFNRALKSFCANGVITRRGILAGAFVFTGIGGSKCKYVRQFAEDIKKNELGEVIELPVFTNPNTGHKILTKVWFPNKVAVLKYFTEHELWVPAFGI